MPSGNRLKAWKGRVPELSDEVATTDPLEMKEFPSGWTRNAPGKRA
jgi:hypothetical protein